ncbi:unnamed protein product [Lymnaea stagnalis]|uniref:Uncharacterized protein n=1 Tax=Lymnaea stagnalis TaxID=6523 RepID=A0AAV2HWZ5_LYMST
MNTRNTTMNIDTLYKSMVLIHLFHCHTCRGQRLTVQPYDHLLSVTQCESGLLDQNDTYQFIGTVNTSEVDVSQRSTLVVQAQDRHTNENTTICTLDLLRSSCKYVIDYVVCCVNDTEETFELEIVIRKTADFTLSCNVIRLIWPSWIHGVADVSNEVLMPKIFREPHETLTINSVLISPICEINQILSGLTYDLEWCVTNLEKHVLQISFRDSSLNVTTHDCIRYHLEPTDIPVNSSFEISYAETGGCRRNNSYTCHFNVTKLVLEPYDQTHSITQCTYGLLEGQDRMLVTGYLNATSEELKDRNIVEFQIGNSKNSEFTSICSIDFETARCSDNKHNASDCYCHRVNNYMYHLTLNTTALLNYSQKAIRLWWVGNDSGVSSNVESVPIIHVNAGKEVVLQLDKLLLNPRNCSLELLHGGSHTFTFCVYNLLHPVIRITKYKKDDEQVPFVRGPCTHMLIRVDKQHFGTMYEFSYKELPGCNRHENFTCSVSDILPPELKIEPDYSFFIMVLVLVGIVSTAAFIYLVKETLRVRHLRETHRPKSRHCTVISKTPTDVRSEPVPDLEHLDSEPSKTTTRISSVDTGEVVSLITRTAALEGTDTEIW